MSASSCPFPDGLEEDCAARDNLLRRHASLFSLLLLGSLLALALLGLLGGARSPIAMAESDAARIVVKTPEVLRNGVFFETRITIEAKRDIAKPVLALPPALWRDLTINSMVPQATDEAYEDGRFTFTYPALKAGDRLEIKIDGQINPPLFAGTRGSVAVLDDTRPLVEVPVTMRVLP